MANKETIQELNDLGSTWLSKNSAVNPYEVPEGYFDQLADQVLNRIRTEQAFSVSDELAAISPLLAGIRKEQPFVAPEHYFDTLPAALLDKIQAQEQTAQNSREETAALSPLLSGISRKMPYSVPEGYFETLSNKLPASPVTGNQARVISITRRSWFRYAAAAVIIGIMAVAGILYFNNRSASQTGNSYAWVEKNMKKVSTNAITNFIQLTDEESTQQPAIAAADKSADLQELMKDVSTKDIQNFLDETAAGDKSDDMDDILLN